MSSAACILIVAISFFFPFISSTEDCWTNYPNYKVEYKML